MHSGHGPEAAHDCPDVSDYSTSVPVMTALTRLSVVALVRDRLVFLVHRHPSPHWCPDCWDLVGGTTTFAGSGPASSPT